MDTHGHILSLEFLSPSTHSVQSLCVSRPKSACEMDEGFCTNKKRGFKELAFGASCSNDASTGPCDSCIDPALSFPAATKTPAKDAREVAAAGLDATEGEEAQAGFTTPPRVACIYDGVFSCSAPKRSLPDSSTTPNLRAASTQSQSAAGPAAVFHTAKYYHQPQHSSICCCNRSSAGHRRSMGVSISSAEMVGNGMAKIAPASWGVEGSTVKTAAAPLCHNHYDGHFDKPHLLQPPPPPKKPKAKPGFYMRWKTKVGHRQQHQNGIIFFNPPDLDAFFKAFTCTK